jgi:hypothetical protein
VARKKITRHLSCEKKTLKTFFSLSSSSSSFCVLMNNRHDRGKVSLVELFSHEILYYYYCTVCVCVLWPRRVEVSFTCHVSRTSEHSKPNRILISAYKQQTLSSSSQNPPNCCAMRSRNFSRSLASTLLLLLPTANRNDCLNCINFFSFNQPTSKPTAPHFRK